MKYNTGLTYIELLVALLISSVLMLGVLTISASQSQIMEQQSRRTQATEDGREAFNIVSRLLKQSNATSITITQPDANSSQIDFTIPSGFPIWPNITAPYTDNAVRLSWSNTGSNANQILIATASSLANLAASTPTALAGATAGNNTQIGVMSLVSNVNGSLSLTVDAKTTGVINNTPLNVSFSGNILPRN